MTEVPAMGPYIMLESKQWDRISFVKSPNNGTLYHSLESLQWDHISFIMEHISKWLSLKNLRKGAGKNARSDGKYKSYRMEDG